MFQQSPIRVNAQMPNGRLTVYSIYSTRSLNGVSTGSTILQPISLSGLPRGEYGGEI